MRNIISLIKIFNDLRKSRYERKKRVLRRKRIEIRGALIKYYEALQAAKPNDIDIPPFMLADNMLKLIIKDKSDIEYYYRMLRKYKACEVIR